MMKRGVLLAGTGLLSLLMLAGASVVTPAEAPRQSLTYARAAFSPGGAESLVVETITGAKKEIRLAAYSFTSPSVSKALVEAHRRGVDVRALLDKSNDTAKYSGITFLRHAGIPVTVITRYAIHHNKFIVVDGETVQTGSFNYTSSAATRNAENVVVIRDAALAATYLTEWSRLSIEANASPQK